MKHQINAIKFSFVLHVALIGCAFSLSPREVPIMPAMVINFTIEQTPFPTQEPAMGQAAERNNGVQEGVRHGIAVEKTVIEPEKKIAEKHVANDKQAVFLKRTVVKKKIRTLSQTTKGKTVEKLIPAESPSRVPVEPSKSLPTLPENTTRGDRDKENSTPLQEMAVHGGRSNGSESVTAGGQYLQRNYNYIRKHIMAKLIYPSQAKKKGWQGKVIASFIIDAVGQVESIYIISSSGHDLLDTNVRKTILKAAPFPKPPGRVKVILPVVYDLKS
jgi:TonB family protein